MGCRIRAPPTHRGCQVVNTQRFCFGQTTQNATMWASFARHKVVRTAFQIQRSSSILFHDPRLYQKPIRRFNTFSQVVHSPPNYLQTLQEQIFSSLKNSGFLITQPQAKQFSVSDLPGRAYNTTEANKVHSPGETRLPPSTPPPETAVCAAIWFPRRSLWTLRGLSPH